MLASALRRHRGDGAFHDLEQRLLHALARDVAGDRGVVGLATDLVDLVDIDDPALGALDIVVGGLQQLEDDVFSTSSPSFGGALFLRPRLTALSSRQGRLFFSTDQASLSAGPAARTLALAGCALFPF